MIKITQEEFIKRSNLKHNNKYDYSKAKYTGTLNKVIIICPNHGEFEQQAGAHMYRQGCRKCAPQYQLLSQEEAIRKFKETHFDKYDYSKVKYIKNHTKVLIICPEHGEFWQSPAHHINGHGCPKCRSENISKLYTKPKNTFLDSAILCHDKYEYNNVVYINRNTKVEIVCKLHGSFWQSPKAHLAGQGCPICKSSKGEIIIRDWLLKNNIKFEEQKYLNKCLGRKNKPLLFDFYIKNSNIVIEYDGSPHYLPHSFSSDQSEETKNKNLKDVQYRDSIKTQYCKDKRIELIRIPYLEIDNIGKILEGKFL